MPNFDCDGGGCGSMYCPSCTPKELRDRYNKECEPIWEDLRKRGATSSGSREERLMKEAEKRARAWWAAGGALGEKFRDLTAAAEKIYPAWKDHDGKVDSKSDIALRNAVKDLRNLLAKQRAD